MLCKIWGFHGSDYEECRRLWYKNPIRISKETHCVSSTESSRLVVWKIRDFHGGDYGKCRPLTCDAVWLYKNRRFGGTYRLHRQGDKNHFFLRLLVTVNFVPSSPILVTPVMEVVYFSEITVLIRAARRHIPEDILSISPQSQWVRSLRQYFLPFRQWDRRFYSHSR
jgi:hypothetical protein